MIPRRHKCSNHSNLFLSFPALDYYAFVFSSSQHWVTPPSALLWVKCHCINLLSMSTVGWAAPWTSLHWLSHIRRELEWLKLHTHLGKQSVSFQTSLPAIIGDIHTHVISSSVVVVCSPLLGPFGMIVMSNSQLLWASFTKSPSFPLTQENRDEDQKHIKQGHTQILSYNKLK